MTTVDINLMSTVDVTNIFIFDIGLMVSWRQLFTSIWCQITIFCPLSVYDISCRKHKICIHCTRVFKALNFYLLWHFTLEAWAYICCIIIRLVGIHRFLDMGGFKLATICILHPCLQCHHMYKQGVHGGHTHLSICKCKPSMWWTSLFIDFQMPITLISPHPSGN